jgi:Mad1 and Cdc20-bound-Mad2 binding
MAYSPKRSLSKRPRKSEVALSEVTDALKNAAINNNHNQEQPSVVRSKSMPTIGARIFSEINIDFPDVLSDVTCSELIIELIKYILFMKEQIPYQYNQLKYVVDRKKKWDLEKKVTKILLDCFKSRFLFLLR